MFLGKSRENKEGKNTLSWQFGTELIKCLKKSGQINDERKIIEKHTVTKRVVLEVKNGKKSTASLWWILYERQEVIQWRQQVILLCKSCQRQQPVGL